MLNKNVFMEALDDFTEEFGGKGYSFKRKELLYSKLIYLNARQLIDLFDIALMELPPSHLPAISKITELAFNRFKRDSNTLVREYQNCAHCENTGQVEAFLNEEPEKWFMFRCFCLRGEQFSGEYFPIWKEEFEKKYTHKFKWNGYVKPEKKDELYVKTNAVENGWP